MTGRLGESSHSCTVVFFQENLTGAPDEDLFFFQASKKPPIYAA